MQIINEVQNCYMNVYPPSIVLEYVNTIKLVYRVEKEKVSLIS